MMSETSVAIAQSFAASQAASTRQTLQTAMVKQQAASDQALVDLLQQSAETQKANLAAGQGQNVDILA
ncbi:hypothetical protein FG93_02049 [Bosea sp. LC85]|nr:hypothetical protein FG93_02049 [Bosea sp. LC85]